MYKVIRCKECETTLWSIKSQHKGICPDCNEEPSEAKELEERLEEILSR